MNVKPLQVDFGPLKDALRSESQLPMKSIEDCKKLSRMVYESTKQEISAIVIERLFGFTQHKFPPSTYTIDTLMLYCGLNWSS